jgi:hypothetical protein
LIKRVRNLWIKELKGKPDKCPVLRHIDRKSGHYYFVNIFIPHIFSGLIWHGFYNSFVVMLSYSSETLGQCSISSGTLSGSISGILFIP